MFDFLKKRKTSIFIPGQIWKYKTRPQDEGSFFTVLKIEKSAIGNIIHLSLDNLKMKRPLSAPPEFITEVEHIPIKEEELLKSILEKVKEGNGLENENEGYNLWKEKDESAFTVPLSETINLIEKGLNGNLHICPTCNKIHQSFSLSFTQPSYLFDLKKGNKLTDDLCVIEGNYFIRVMLYIPIIDHEESFAWGVWVSQSKENFDLYKKNFRKDLTNHEAFGWLSNTLPGYEDTMNLKTLAHFQKNGMRPIVEIEKAEHQLCKDFIEGITIKRAEELMCIAGDSMIN